MCILTWHSTDPGSVEFSAEGFVLGVGANMFKNAGPVIVYGVCECDLWGCLLDNDIVLTGG